MSFSSDLLSARSAAGVGVDVEGTSGAVPVATLWIGAGGGGGTLTPAAADKPGDRDIGGEDGKLERGNSGLSPKPVMETPDNPLPLSWTCGSRRTPPTYRGRNKVINVTTSFTSRLSRSVSCLFLSS